MGSSLERRRATKKKLRLRCIFRAADGSVAQLTAIWYSFLATVHLNLTTGILMKLRSRIAISAVAVGLLFTAIQAPAFARSASNIGHGTTCYNVPTTNANGTVTWTRVCFKRA